ncbi:hypothetical protein [Paraburkholderia sp. BCC1884]|uniref:hypothetical protein n=1 Tax=Paraburkholderia sp. BCC1884 TaxID=2562668 RepID=UPI001182CBF5|nr:hypothetical protein [Paraburkholderia sp. BCC1884]
MSLIDKLSERCHEARLAPAKFAFIRHLDEIPLTGDKVRSVDCFHISDFAIQTDYTIARRADVLFEVPHRVLLNKFNF